MVAGSFTREHVAAVSLDRLWKAIAHDGHSLVPNLLPDLISSVEFIEGDGGLGTVKKVNFTEAVKVFCFRIEKTEVIDDENHIIKFAAIEGGHFGQDFISHSIEIKLDAVNNSGTLSQIKLEYDAINEALLTVEEENEIVKGLLRMMQALEGYLIENPTSYA